MEPRQWTDGVRDNRAGTVHLSGNRSSAIVAGVSSSPPRRVALFVTCLVDLFRPSVGFAAVKLLEDAGCIVEVPPLQVCCGQPAYNSGDRASTKAIARQVIDAFEGYHARGRAVGLVRRHAGASLSRPVRRRSGDEGAGREPGRALP